MEIEEINVASMRPEERGSRAVLYEELRRVDCMTRISPGVTRGINAAFLKDKLRAILHGVPYGEPGGHKRRILSVFLRRSGAVSTRTRQVRPVSAFALVCAPAHTSTSSGACSSRFCAAPAPPISCAPWWRNTRPIKAS